MNEVRTLSWRSQITAVAAVTMLAVYTNHIKNSPSPLQIVTIFLLLIVACVAVSYSLRFEQPQNLHGINKDIFSSNAGKVDWLKFLRFLAALIVFAMHSGIVLGLDFTHSNANWAWLIYSPAWFGMSMFFTLSGYLIIKGFLTSRF